MSIYNIMCMLLYKFEFYLKKYTFFNHIINIITIKLTNKAKDTILILPDASSFPVVSPSPVSSPSPSF